MLLSMTSVGLAVGVLLRRKRDLVVDARHSSLGMLSVGLRMVTAGIGGAYSRSETLLFFIPKETVPLFPIWASVLIAIIGCVLVANSAIEHRG